MLSSYDASLSSSEAESAIVAILVLGDISNNFLVGSGNKTFTSPSNGSTWSVSSLDASYIDQSLIYNNPSATIRRDCIITTKHVALNPIDSYTVNISSSADASNSNSNSETFYMEPTSSSLYDSNYVVSTSLIQNCYDSDISLNGIPSTAHIQATFDTSNNNANIQQALQSEFNTTVGPYTQGLSTVGPDPLSMSEDVSFNETGAYGGGLNTDGSGVYQSYWATNDVSNGNVNFTQFDASNQLTNNSYDVTKRTDFSSNPLNLQDDIGVFKFVQNKALIDVRIVEDGSMNIASTNGLLQKIPFFDASNSGPVTPATTLLTNPIPGTMDEDQFFTLFNTGVANTVAEKWTFDMDVSSVTNSGYNLDTSCGLVSSFNNSNIFDNPYYMEKYVNQSHTLDFSSAHQFPISITDSSYGYPSTSNNITIDLSNGETLSNGLAGINGQIKIDTNTPNTRTTLLDSNQSPNSITTEIWYPSETTSVSAINSIDNDEMMSSLFETFIQKIAQSTADPSANDVFITNNDAMLTLYSSDQVENSKFNTADFSFNFSKNSFNDDSVRLWRVNALNELITDPLSLYDSSTNTVIPNIYTSGYMTNLNISDDNTVFNNSKYQLALTKKSITNLGLYADVSNASGWSVRNTGTKLNVFSKNAYASENNLPIYSKDLFSGMGPSSKIYYKYEYYIQNNDDTRSGGMQESIKVEYSSNDLMTNPTTFIIPESDITRGSFTQDISYNIVADSSYTLLLPYDKSKWSLVNVTNTTKYNIVFDPKYCCYDNIEITIKGITQKTTYYALRNNVGKYAPASALKYVNYPGITVAVLTNIREILLPALNTSLSLSGILPYADLCPFKSTIQGLLQDGIWNNVSDLIDTDVFYGLPNTYELIDIDISNNATADAVVMMEYTAYTEGGNSSSSNTSLTESQYYIPFDNNNYNTSYSVSSFASTPSDLSANTSLGSSAFGNNTEYLTVQDNYSNTNTSSWDSSQYTVSVVTSGNPNNITTTLIVSSTLLGGQKIFDIQQKKGTTFLGNFIVSYIPLDIYRSERLLGTDINYPTQISSFNETFVSTTYSVSQGTDTVNNIVGFPNIPGFYLRNNYSPFSSSTVVLGNYFSYRVLSEYVSVQMIGYTSDPSSNDELTNINSLTYSDNSGNNHSAIIILPKYRGYQTSYNVTQSSFTNIIQVYTINRDSTTVTFRVGTDVSQMLTPNMYYGETLIVNNLVDTYGTCANLNISCLSKYSIPPTGSNMSYNIILVADLVTVTINNPNYTGDASNISVPSGSTPVLDPKYYTDSMTLLNYGQNNMYTFSGLFNGIAPVSIRPSRIKLRNIAYAFNSLTYYIKYNFSNCDIYKAISQDISYNWLGNPDASTNWSLQDSFDSSQIKAGINIGNYFINLRADERTKENKSYFVSCPPYYKFNCVSSANAAVIPYNYSSVSSNNLITRYLPYTGLVKIFNPFASTVSIQDINNNTLSYTNDQAIINNITFTLVNNYSPTLTTMLRTADTKIYTMIVPGINVSIDLYKGDSSGNSSATLTHHIYNGPITSIPTTANISNTSIVFRNRDASGGIHFSLLQFPEDVGFPSGLDTYESLYQTSIQSNYYTINLCMENPSWYNNNKYSSVYFDANAVGTKPTLYTSVIMYNPLSKHNFIRIYKYLTNSKLEFNSPITPQTLNIIFDKGREYFDCALSSFTFTATSTFDLTTLIQNSDVYNLNVTWTLDIPYINTNTTIGWAFANSTVATQMPIELFDVQVNETKCVFIKLLETIKAVNQFNIPTLMFNWDGTLIAKQVNAANLTLFQSTTSAIINTSDITGYGAVETSGSSVTYPE
jgi:hypothetical protein